jgi:hypothetical protein
LRIQPHTKRDCAAKISRADASTRSASDVAPVGADRCGDVGQEELDRDFAIVLDVVGEHHDRHAPAAELTPNRVASHQ